jgi:hypothetical protein
MTDLGERFPTTPSGDDHVLSRWTRSAGAADAIGLIVEVIEQRKPARFAVPAPYARRAGMLC